VSEIKQLQDLIGEWADEVFPDRTIQSAALKLYEEIGEMLRDPSNADEHADIYIMMFDLSRMYNVDISAAVRRKMARNRLRQWGKTETGTLQHVEQVDASWYAIYEMGVDDFRRGKPPQNRDLPEDMAYYYMKGYSDAGAAEDEGSTLD
jgi:hypothetical protein